MAWLSGWTYRKSITLSRASGLVTNYQMKLLVGESSGATGEDVDCGGKCLSTFNDLRFTTSDGSTLLDYWIESVSGTTPNGLATVWIEFDSIGTGDTTFYMYYGKADAAAASDGASTFINFVDNGGTPDTDGWSSVDYRAGDVALRVRAMIPDTIADYSGVSFSTATRAYIRLQRRDASANQSSWQNYDGAGYRDWSTTALGFNSIHIYELGRIASGTAKALGWVDGVSAGTDTARVPTADVKIQVSANVQLYWAFIRNYRETEPVWGSWGSEEESTVIFVPSVSLILTAHQGIQIFPIFAPASSLSLSGYAPTYLSGSQIECANLIIIPHAPSLGIKLFPALASLTLAAQLPSYVWSIPANLRPAAQVIYTCTLTGDGESPAVSDLTLPMSSFQGRMRDGDPSYISAVIPNCMIYADAILARQNGDIVIKKGYRFQDGTTQLEEIARVDFESVRIDQGSKSASATISGHKTISSTSVKTITVEGVSYYCLQADGKRRVRALLDLFLRIGDTCVYGTGASDYLTVGYITYTVSVNQTIMEVTEA